MVDNLPKQNGDDWSNFTGSYPTDKPAQSTPTPPSGVSSAVGQPSPISTPSPAVKPPITSEPPAPFTGMSQTDQPPSTPVMTTVPDPFAQTGAAVSPSPTTEEPPASPTSFDAVPSPSAPKNANPFVIAESPSVSPTSPNKGTARRAIAFIILLIALLAIGFLAFKVVGGFLASNQPVTLTYWGLWEDELILTPLIAEYKKTHPRVEVVYSKQGHKQYRERLQAAIVREDGPDLFRFHNTWVPMFKNDLAAAGSTGYSVSEFQQTFYPVASADLVIGGKVYGAPLMIDGLGLYYNEDLLRAAGVTPPATWEEFRTAALALTVKDQNGAIVTSGAALGTAGNIEHFSEIVSLMMLQNGAVLSNPTTKEAVDALSFYHLFAEKPANVWDDTLDNSILAFANGKVAMIFAPSWQVFTVKQINPNLKFQIIPVPQLPGTSATWASYWVEGVSSKSKHQAEAWEFLKFLTSKESEIMLYTEASKTRLFGEPYSRVDLAQPLIPDSYVGAYIRQAPTAQSFFLAARTFDNGINDLMIKYVEDAVNSLNKGVAPDAALQTVATGFKQVLSRFGFTTAP